MIIDKGNDMGNKQTAALKIFHWTGIDASGAIQTGELEAKNKDEVKRWLEQQSILLQKASMPKRSFKNRFYKQARASHIESFSRQLATLIGAGIPIVQALKVMAKSEPNLVMQQLLGEIQNALENGASIHEAFKKHPQYFNGLFCSMVAVGEQSGTLDILLTRLATHQEKMLNTKKKIKTILSYPLIIVLVAFIVSSILLVLVIPQFETMFRGFGAELPAFTRMVISVSKFFQAYMYLLFSFIIGALLLLSYARSHSERFSKLVDQKTLQLPLLGRIMAQAITSRFARALGITLAAGLPILDALESATQASNHGLYIRAYPFLKDQISQGTCLHQALVKTQLFAELFLQMMAIGEASGTLESLLSKMADFYEAEVDRAVDTLGRLLEPVIMVFLGLIVGGLLIAMYLPIFRLGS